MNERWKTLLRRSLRPALLTAGAVALVLALALPWLATHHVVRTDKGTVIVAKRFVSLHQSCADIRGWTWQDADGHPALRDALVGAGYGDLLPKARTGEKTWAGVRERLDRFENRCRRAWRAWRAKPADAC